MSTPDDRTDTAYLHGLSAVEQARPVKQARIAESTVFRNIDYTDAQRLLEVGSGVGAQTEILLRRFPDLHATCVDLNQSQIDAARDNLGRCRSCGGAMRCSRPTRPTLCKAIGTRCSSIRSCRPAQRCTECARTAACVAGGVRTWRSQPACPPVPRQVQVMARAIRCLIPASALPVATQSVDSMTARLTPAATARGHNAGTRPLLYHVRPSFHPNQGMEPRRKSASGSRPTMRAA